MILVSQYLGAGDTKRVGRTCTAALLMNLIFGLAVSLLLILGCGPIFRLMGVHDLIFAETCLYMRIIGAGMVFQAVYLTFTAFFRSAQLMRETMLVSIFMNCLNIGGNYILINGRGPLPALGVAEAAGECIRAVLFLIRWQSGAWRRKRLLEPEQAGPM